MTSIWDLNGMQDRKLVAESWTVAPQVESVAVVTELTSIGSSKANFNEIPIDTPVLPLLGITTFATTFGLELSVSTTGSGSGTGLALSLVSSEEQATTNAPSIIEIMSRFNTCFGIFITISLSENAKVSEVV
jgi:hypothetical protein